MSYRKYVKLVPSVLNGEPREKGKDTGPWDEEGREGRRAEV